MTVKFRKPLSLLLASLMVIGSASFAASAAVADSEDIVGAYSNQSYLENYAEKAYNVQELGSTYSPSATTFKTWSPEASSVKVKLYKTGSDSESGSGTIGEYPMSKDSNTGVWSLSLNGDHKNQYYTYVISVKGQTNETQDIYSKAVGVNGNRSMVVDLDSTDPDGWNSDRHVVFQNAGEAVVWEVHVRDFSASESSGVSYDNRGKYLGFTESGTTLNGTAGDISTGIDYLVEQGINCVQLMPVYDFQSVDETAPSATNRNWGYDPQNYNAPEGSYSTNPYDGNVRIKEFKQMIQALHDRNISVVMDVVYNHTYNTASSFEKTVPGYYYRMNSSTKFSNGSGCGNETASDKKMYRKFMIESIKYWMDEYHIDGFRFDLMGLHDVATMNEIRSNLDGFYADGTGRKVLMYGEPWTGGDTLNPDPIFSWQGTGISRLDSRVGAFGDQYRDAIKGDTDSTGKGFVQGNTSANTSKIVSGVKGKVYSAASPKSPAQALSYADAHDNLIMWDKIVKSNGSSDYTGTNAEFQKQMKEIYTLLLTSQGIPFMTAGSEFGRTKQGDHNSYKSPDSINAIDWNRVKTMSGLAAYYKGMLAIRKNYSSLHASSIVTPSFQSEMGDVVAYTYTNNTAGEWNKLAVLVNGGSQAWTINLSGSGWVVVANGTSAGLTSLGEVSGSSYSIPAKGSAVLVDKASFNNLVIKDGEGTLTVNHVDQSGNVLKTQTATYKAGMTYRATPDADLLFDYELIDTQGETSGTVAAGGSYTVTFVYQTSGAGSGYVNVTHVDASGKKLAEPEKSRYKIGASYSTAPVAIAGYQLDTSKIPANAAGTFSGDVDVKYVYTPLASNTVKIHYKNTNNWSTVRCYAYYTNDAGATVELNGKWNSAKVMSSEGSNWYGATFTAPRAYALFHNGNGSTNTAQDPGDVGYLCIGEVWIESGVTTFGTKVITSHVDAKTGQKIADDVIETASKVSSTDSYTTSPLAGRTDYIEPANATGKYSVGAVNVIYYYTGGQQPTQPVTDKPTEPTTVKPTEKPTEPTTQKPTVKPTTQPVTEPTTQPVTVPVTKLLVGDVNFDGEINIVDATMIQRIAAEIISPTEAQKIAGDVDGNGIVTITDATMVQRYAASLETGIGNAGKYVDGPMPPAPTTQPTTAKPTEKPTEAPTTVKPTEKPTVPPTTVQPTTVKPTEAPTDPPAPSVYLNATAVASGTEDWYIWTWSGSGEGHWLKGSGDASRVTFSGDIGSSLLFVRLPQGASPSWNPSNIWNQTEDQTTRIGGTFVMTSYGQGSGAKMYGSWS